MITTSIAIHNDLVAGIEGIFARLRRESRDSPIQLEVIEAKRIQIEIAMLWMLHIKITKRARPSREASVKALRPLGIYYASLYELCRQRVGESAPALFLECLEDLILSEGVGAEKPGKAGYTKAQRNALAFLADEIASLDTIARDQSPFGWLMQQSAWNADQHDAWGLQFWHSAQRRRWAENATPFLNAWAVWLRHAEREKGLAVTDASGDRLVFLMRGGSKKTSFAKTDF